MMRSVWKFTAAAVVLFVATAPAAAATFESAAIRVGGLDRDYYYHRPEAVRREAPMAVVFVLHGGAGRAKQFAGYLNFDTFVDPRNLLVVYPQGFERHWNDGRGDTTITTQQRGIDDIAFLRAVLDALAERYPIDRRRVYVAGISNGGMMALRLACAAADTFAAVAAIAASMPDGLAPDCRPARPVPVLLINGTEDPLVPYHGGAVGFGRRDRGKVRSTPDTISQWAGLNGCTAPSTIRVLPDGDPDDGSRITVERRLACRAGTEVTLYRVDGGGHTWPGRPPYLPRFIIGRTNRDIDATEHILDFFDRHARGQD
jgi:polyhydroxybutyrate depolymerase